MNLFYFTYVGTDTHLPTAAFMDKTSAWREKKRTAHRCTQFVKLRNRNKSASAFLSLSALLAESPGAL